MKLIIDIPENVIEGAKSSPNYYPAYHFEKIWRAIANGTPYEERPQGEWIEFTKFVARGVCDDDFKDNSDCFAELACRKLVKLGLLKLDGDTYKFCKADMKAVRND